jgi:hypothetical protein
MILVALAFAAPAAAAEPHPLFVADDTIRLTIRGPLGAIRRGAEGNTDARDATLTLAGAAGESHAIRLSARGLSRRRPDVCSFPPLRIDFAAEPAATSFFRGQRRLKLVTHCQASESFQQYLLREYMAYRLLNALSPRSLRVRLAQIDYVEAGATAPFVSRLGFLIEDVDDAARRNGLVEIETGNIAPRQLNPEEAARAAVFHYMVGNLDWSITSGPRGDSCCHNGKLLGAAAGATTGLIPIPYDFDFSGLVDAPYSAPPDQVPVDSVRSRRYRGFCIHNAEAQTVAAEFRAARAALLAIPGTVPGLTSRNRDRAVVYLSRFFDDIRDSAAVSSNLLGTCVR